MHENNSKNQNSKSFWRKSKIPFSEKYIYECYDFGLEKLLFSKIISLRALQLMQNNFNANFLEGVFDVQNIDSYVNLLHHASVRNLFIRLFKIGIYFNKNFFLYII